MSRLGVVLIAGLVAGIVLADALFIVREDKQVIITQFGEPIGGPITEPGLKIKLPFFQKLHVFEKRFLEWQGDAEELTTRDKKYIYVDVYARWRIAEPLLFFQRLTNETNAQSRLDDILDGETRNAIARHDLLEVVRSTNREPVLDENAPTDVFKPIEGGRDRIRQQILEAAKTTAAGLGIEILDVQFRRINYSDPETQNAVFQRMISERKRIADRFRSEGQGEAARILGEMDRELKRIQSEAYRQAEEIRGRADAEATQIYASVYDRSADSRVFYEFLQTMATFESTIDDGTTLVLSTDGEFYRFLEGSGR
ncbi:MAG TPA: protease modulator HflC [Thermoanaerobaculia bacterium]|nr:protease modulator HflC [Thermoanaerobaculia bacterium]